MPIYTIEGNIGSGKSTLIKYLEKLKLDFVFLPEPVDAWEKIKDNDGKNIIELYYNDQGRYAFAFQMMAYISRLSLLRKANKFSIIITERCLHTDREIFAKMLYDSGKIDDPCYQIYLMWFDEFLSEAKVNGIIYIKTLPETCLKRISIRNRQGESIPLEYLSSCHEYHENWINNTDIPKIILNGENTVETLVDEITKFILTVR